MSRLEPRTLCVVAVVLLAAVAGAAAPGAAQSTRTVAGTQIAPDDVSLRIDVRENRSAVWEVEYRVLLDDENATAAFESVEADVRNNETAYTSEFHDRMDATARTAENATGREMDVRNVTVSVSRQQLPQEYGVVTYRFVWTNFTAPDGDGMRAGDAVSGLFLDEDTSLIVTWPDGYAATEVRPDPDDRRNGTVVWNGPFDFGTDEPSITLAPRAAATADGAGTDDGGADAAGTDGAATTTGEGTGPAGGSNSSNPLFLGAGLLLVVTAVGGGWVFYRRREEMTRARAPSGGGPDGASPTPAPGHGGSDDGAGDDVPTTGDDAADGTGGDGATDATGGGDATDATAEPDAEGAPEDADDAPWEDELLSNEERVLALIEHEGGRLKQQEVAGTLDWTDAKTSQVVRKMRDEDRLDAFRLGRENVLVLPEEGDDQEDGL